MTLRAVCPLAALQPNEPTLFEADGQRIAVVRVGEEVFAVSEQCTHEDWSLCEGYVDGHVIICPLHGARFSLRTGELLLAPGDGPLDCYPVQITSDLVWVDTEPRR